MSDNYIGAAMCQARHKTAHPPVPYGPENANAAPARLVEEGYKQVRGSLTEGRYLTFEMDGYGLAHEGTELGNLTTCKSTPGHEDIRQRWIIHLVGEQGGSAFNLQSAFDLSYISINQTLVASQNDAQVFEIIDLGNGKGYRLVTKMPAGSIDDGRSELRTCFIERQSLSVRKGVVGLGRNSRGWKVFSVTYQS